MHNRIYDSEGADRDKLYTFRNLYGHAEDTDVFFEKENLHMIALETGEITFESADKDFRREYYVKPDTKNGLHSNIYCMQREGKILAWFPVCGYEDNYPYCDGEYDRWTEYVIEYVQLTFDLSAGEITETVVKTIE